MTYKLCAIAAACFALGACAPTVWERPGTTPLQFSMDSARCEMMAEGTTPDADVGTVRTGKFGRDLAINAALGIVGGLAHAGAVNQKFALCMQANGYAGHPAGTAPAPMAFGAAAPLPDRAGARHAGGRFLRRSTATARGPGDGDRAGDQAVRDHDLPMTQPT
jgi:hypothetical protein